MKIFILGAGRMGAWLTEEFCLDHDVAIYDRDLSKLKFFFKVTRISELAEIKDFNPDIAINCASLRYTRDAFDEILPYLGKECILADIMSVKGDIQNFYKESGHPFVSLHPMFGPTFANLRNLSGENAIIIKESDAKAKEFFFERFRQLGLNIYEYTFEEHDEAISYGLSIPFASSMVFAACMKHQDAPGTTFKKHLAIAKGLLSEDDYLLAEIMFNPQTQKQVEVISNKLNYLRHILKGRDYEEMSGFLNDLRDNIREK